MTRSSKPKPEMCIAGPGAGKTYGMVQRIVEVLPSVPPHRFIAVVTYTNSAVDAIRSQFAKIATPTPNLFIGTTHAFLNRFILEPFGHPLRGIPLERRFVANELHNYASAQDAQNPIGRAIRRKAITRKLVTKGVIPFDELVNLSAELICDKRVRKVIANRLQVLFIDEFQDLDSKQLTVIDEIRKAGKTQIHVVGDPEQYISGFGYKDKGRKPKPYDKIPFFTFERSCDVQYLRINRRSCEEIVRFTNNFHGRLQQEVERPSTDHSGVYFLDTTDRDELVSLFRTIAYKYESSVRAQHNRPHTRLVLAPENKVVNSLVDRYQLAPISNDLKRPANTLAQIFAVFELVTGQSLRRLSETTGMTRLELRKSAVRLARRIRCGDIDTKDRLLLAVHELLQIALSQGLDDTALEEYLNRISMLQRPQAVTGSIEMCSTVHKAKGLEADSVLTIASREGDLKRWLETDVQKRAKSTDDMCRIGYVAFTRARDVLCIACLVAISQATRTKLEQFGVQIYPEPRCEHRQLTLGF